MKLLVLLSIFTVGVLATTSKSCNEKIAKAKKFDQTRYEFHLKTLPQDIDINNSEIFSTFERLENGEAEYIMAIAQKRAQKFGLEFINSKKKSHKVILDRFAKSFYREEKNNPLYAYYNLVNFMAISPAVPIKWMNKYFGFFTSMVPKAPYRAMDEMMTIRLLQGDVIEFAHKFGIVKSKGNFKDWVSANWPDIKRHMLGLSMSTAFALATKDPKMFLYDLMGVNFFRFLVKDVSREEINKALTEGVRSVWKGNKRYISIGGATYASDIALKGLKIYVYTLLGMYIQNNYQWIAFGVGIAATLITWKIQGHEIKGWMDSYTSLKNCMEDLEQNWRRQNKKRIINDPDGAEKFIKEKQIERWTRTCELKQYGEQ